MAITNVDIKQKGTYSTEAGGSLVLSSEKAAYVTYIVTLTLGKPEEINMAGNLTISGLTAGVTPWKGNTINLTSNGMNPYAEVRLLVNPSATELNFSVTPVIDDGETFNATPAYATPLSIAWVGAGLLYPTLAAGGDPNDVPALDTSSPGASATLTVKLVDNSNTPLEGVAVLFGPTNSADNVGSYVYNDAFTGASLTFGGDTIPQTNGPAIKVKTDTNGQAGIAISIKPGDTAVAVQAQLVAWGAQLQGGGDAYFFSSDDALFIGPLLPPGQFSSAAPEIVEAMGELHYEPNGAPTCTLEIKADWDSPDIHDHILVIVGDENTAIPRQLLTVNQTDHQELFKGARLSYQLDVNRLISPNCPLRLQIFRGTELSNTTFSHVTEYTVGELPHIRPPQGVLRLMPAPRLFSKDVADDGSPKLGDELLPGATITWDFIKYGGIYVYIPYAASISNAGLNGKGTLSMYKTGVYQGQSQESSAKAPYPITVSSAAVTPSGTGYGLGPGLLKLIGIQDLRNWNRLPNGYAGGCQVEYRDASGKTYSHIWEGYIDTVPIQA